MTPDVAEFLNLTEFLALAIGVIILFAVVTMMIVDKWFIPYYCANCHERLTLVKKRYNDK